MIRELGWIFEDVFAPLLFMLIIMSMIGGGVAVVSHYYGAYQCENFSTITGKPTRWAAFDSCYIQTAAGWERWDEYKGRAIASEGLKGKS